MKKVMTLFLAVVMACSVCACGAETENGAENDAIRVEQNYSEPGLMMATVDYAIFATQKEMKNHLKRVTLTKDNWQEYFGDYEYTEHIVNKNSFGEIEEEYDVVHKGFGGGKVIALKDVAFKFSALTIDGTDNEKFYPEENDCFVVDMNRTAVEMNYNGKACALTYFKAEDCIDATGEIIVCDLDINTLERPSLHWATPRGKLILTTSGIGDEYSWETFLSFME